jgi:hypothetical protein
MESAFCCGRHFPLGGWLRQRVVTGNNWRRTSRKTPIDLYCLAVTGCHSDGLDFALPSLTVVSLTRLVNWDGILSELGTKSNQAMATGIGRSGQRAPETCRLLLARPSWSSSAPRLLSVGVVRHKRPPPLSCGFLTRGARHRYGAVCERLLLTWAIAAVGHRSLASCLLRPVADRTG